MSVEPDARTLSPRRLHEDDVAKGFVLSSSAGWNQLESDWKIMIEMGQGLGLVDPDDNLVGTAILLPFRKQIDWVSMVLVDESWRRRGVGTRLMRLLVELSVNPVLGLDATDMGLPVYEGLGFNSHDTITRYRRGASGRDDTRTVPELVGFTRLDIQSFRDALPSLAPDVSSARSQLLGSLDPTGQGMASLVREGTPVAVSSSRPGRNSVQIGPLFATDAATATTLFKSQCSQIDGSVIVDVPDRNAAFAEQVRKLGFEPFRHFTRMYRGGLPRSNPNEYAVAGPEFG